MKNQKHILFISSWYPNRNNLTHGIFNFYLAQAASIYNKVSVIHVCSDEQLKQKFELVNTQNENIHTIIVYYQKIKSKMPVISQWQKRNRLIEAFDLGYQELLKSSEPPQLIQLNVVLPAGLGALYLSKKHHLPLVVNENWSGYTKEDGNYKGFFVKYFTQKIIASAKKIMPTSTYLKEAMLEHSLKGDYQVVPNVVDVKKFVPLQKKLSPHFRLIHISSLIEREKNVSGILRAFKQALLLNSNLELVIVGGDENKNSFIQLAHELNIHKQVIFKGRLTSEQVVSEMNQANALIMFSHYETFCLVIIEAFACGKPVITSNAGAIPSYMTNQLGIMVEKNNELQLTEAILKLAHDPNQFDSQVIRKFAEQYSYENIGAQLNDIYNSVLTSLK